jgi:uncharacterized Tic20 family protein
MLAYLGMLIGGFVPALVVYLLKKDQSRFLKFHGAQGLNLTITVFGGAIVSWILLGILSAFSSFFSILFILPLAIYVAGLIFAIKAAMAANQGESYQIPNFIAFPIFK